MTKNEQYNKFIKNPSNSNLLINVSLVAGFLIIILSQVFLFKTMAQDRLQVSNTSTNSTTSTSASGAILTASSDIELTGYEAYDLTAAVALVKPSIVNIDVVSSKVSSSSPGQGPALNFDFPSQQSLSTNEETIGSGVIVDEKGYILTCYHLIKDNPEVWITLFNSNQKKYKADIISIDKANNLALLKIYPDSILPKAKFGNSDLVQITDTVLTIGSPFGFEYTVTGGIISDNKRSIVIEGTVYEDLFQTDASLNRGSSGGALINSAGEVIGINAAIVSASEYFTGVSFAIPINKARPLILQEIWN